MNTEAQFECEVCQRRVIADVDQFICDDCSIRVRVARIIDPSKWATMDTYRAAARGGRFVDMESISKADAILAALAASPTPQEAQAEESGS